VILNRVEDEKMFVRMVATIMKKALWNKTTGSDVAAARKKTQVDNGCVGNKAACHTECR
jgi:hypothetical protein